MPRTCICSRPRRRRRSRAPGTLREGDAVRLTEAGGQRITAIDDSEILIWEMHATARN